HVQSVADRFGHLENVTIEYGDLEDRETFDGLESAYDSVLSVNVLEHLEKPEIAVEGFAKALRSGGHALVLVPAHDWLFSAADEALGHTTRYSREGLVAVLESAGFEVEKIWEFNRLGVLGWMVNKALQR